MKKITFFMPPLSDGGVEKTVLTLASLIAVSGHNVTLVTVRASGPFIKEIDPAVKLVNFNVSKALYSIYPFINYLKKDRPDVVISAQYYINILCLLAVKLSKVKCKTIITERLSPSAELEELPFLKKIIMPFLMKKIYPLSDEIVAVSKDAAYELELLIDKKGRSVKHIYNPTIHDDIFKRAEEEISHPWYVNKEKPIIIGVGRLGYQKDFQTLVRAFAELRKSLDARLVILGQGPDKHELETLAGLCCIEKDFQLLGFKQNPYPYVKKSDLFVLSSRYEGMPNVMIESLALDVPVISTLCKTGPDEILSDEFLVAVGDHKSMAQKMIKMLTDKEEKLKQRQDVEKKLQEFKPAASLNHYLTLID